MKKILFLLSDRELETTHGKVVLAARNLAKAGHRVDVYVHADKVANKLRKIPAYPNFQIVINPGADKIWKIHERDQMAKEFVSLAGDQCLPGTDFRFWKQVTFDDYLWNISTHVYGTPTEIYDVVIVPLQSTENPPSGPVDIFYTYAAYYARQNNLPLIGWTYEPAQFTSLMSLFVFDYFCVPKEEDKAWFVRQGVAGEKVFVLTDPTDLYLFSSLDDPFRWPLVLPSPIKEGMLGITIINHVKGRNHFVRILRMISELPFPTPIFFVFVNYAVKDIHEKHIFEQMFLPEIKKAGREFYVVDIQEAGKALAVSDLVIATNYNLLTNFYREEYSKNVVTFNPYLSWVPQGELIQDIPSLKQKCIDVFEAKKNRISLKTILGAIGV